MKLRVFMILLFVGVQSLFVSVFLGAQDSADDSISTELQTAGPADENAPAKAALTDGIASEETTDDALSAYNIDPEGEFHIPESLKNNRYYLDSLKFSNLARLSFYEGDYDQSAWYSSEAARLARLSDEYISEKLKSSQALAKLNEAGKRVDWADSNGIEEYYPKETEQAHKDYDEAVDARKVEDWDKTIEYSDKTIADLADVAAPPPKGGAQKGQPKLPTQYKVRPWDEFGDCFWNISKWFYGSPWYWPVLFNANKHKLPDPNNPNLIEIGTLLDIPSIDGEIRVGLYDTGILYKN